MFGFLLTSFVARTQTSNEYTVDQIADLVTDVGASAYDEYILTTDGGVYDVTQALEVSSTATIKAASDLVSKPVLTYTVNVNNWDAIFRIRNTTEVITLTVENVEIDLTDNIGLVVRADDASNIIVKGSYIHSSTNSNGSFRLQTDGISITMENTLVTDCNQRFIHLYTPDAVYGPVNLINCSFNNMGGPVVYYRSSGGVVAIGTDVMVDHVTFNEVGGTEGVLKFRNMTGQIVVKNSIFSNVAGTIESSFVVPDYCYVNGLETVPEATNSIEVDPVFADAANNNLTLLNADQMIGGDFQILGDLTWYDDAFAPVVFENLVRVDDTHVRVEFNEMMDSETLTVLTNYTLGGTFGLTGNPTAAVVAEDAKSVVLEVSDLTTMNFNETVEVTVENVTDLAGNPIEDANVATYIYLDETPPVVTMAQQELTNDEGVFALAQSNETGMIYLVMEGEEIATLADFQTAIDGLKGASAVVEAADTDVQIAVSGLLVGNYFAWAVDDYENISAQSENQVVLTDNTPPVVTLEPQEVTNASSGADVTVATTEPGTIYLILEGEAASSEDDFQAAVAAGNGAMEMVDMGGELEITLSMANVTPGMYYAYAVDLSGNISAVSENAVTVIEYVPRVRYYTDQQTAELSNDIISASDGDVFILTTDGGDYALEAWHRINAKITIMADRDLLNRPVISNYRESSTYQIFRLNADGSSLTLKGVELNSKEHPTFPVKYMIRADSNIGRYSLVVEDCHFRGAVKDGGGTILKTYGGTYADSIIFRNCIFEDSEAISMTGLSTENSPEWDYMEITNCTFMNIPEEVIAIKDQPSVNKEFPILVDHATFYNVGSESQDVIFADSLTKVTVTNSIFVNSPSPTIFDIYGDDSNQSTIDYFNYFEANLPVAVGSGMVGSNVWNQDPQFANPAEDDLTLGNIDLYTLGSDGLPLGDLRWADVLGPKVLQEVLALSDSTLLIRFSEPIDTTSATVADNYVMSGTAGLTGTVKNVELYNFQAVVVTTGSFIGLTDLDLVITVSNVEDLNGNVVDVENNTVTYTVEQLMPVVFADEQQVTNANDQVVVVQTSLGSGFAYIVLDGEPQETADDLENAVSAGNGAKQEVVASYTDVEISTHTITPGTYYAYYVDAGGNMSEKDDSPIIITDGIAPLVTASVQSVTNGQDEVVLVQSNEDNGRVYIMLDGVPQATLADFLTAVALKNAAMANITAADTDMEISTTGITPGIYFPYAIDAAGNISEKGASPINITMATNVNVLDETTLKVFASNGKIFISSDQTDIQHVMIFDIVGRKVKDVEGLETGHLSTQVDHKGVYIVKVIDGSNRISTTKVIVQ
jgi:hypothetical protein